MPRPSAHNSCYFPGIQSLAARHGVIERPSEHPGMKNNITAQIVCLPFTEAAHGPENLIETPIRFVCVIVSSAERT